MILTFHICVDLPIFLTISAFFGQRKSIDLIQDFIGPCKSKVVSALVPFVSIIREFQKRIICVTMYSAVSKSSQDGPIQPVNTLVAMALVAPVRVVRNSLRFCPFSS